MTSEKITSILNVRTLVWCLGGILCVSTGFMLGQYFFPSSSPTSPPQSDSLPLAAVFQPSKASLSPSPEPSPQIKVAGYVTADKTAINTGVVESKITPERQKEAAIADQRTDLFSKVPINLNSCTITYDQKNLKFLLTLNKPFENSKVSCAGFIRDNYPLISEDEFVYLLKQK
jgi:hypothetical protein